MVKRVQDSPPFVERHMSSKKVSRRLRYEKFPVSSAPKTGSLRNTLFSNTPGKVQCAPPSVLNAHPPCRKSDCTLLNCLQPIVILLPSVGSTAMDGSLAASPSMLL